MGDSAIEWCTKTWNPIVGCSYVSPGCDGCYAARDASGRLKTNPVYAGLAAKDGTHPLPRFTGEVRMLGPGNPWGRDRLDDPLRWRTPARVFVNSMSDLFHPDVPEPFIHSVWSVMERAPQHTFQILTKRPDRMAHVLGDWRYFDAPLRQVWLGTSVETQRYADLRIPHLLATPAAVRFLSVEPLLGPVDLTHALGNVCPWCNGTVLLPGSNKSSGQKSGPPNCWHCNGGKWTGVDWVIVGGESGPGARPMHPDWARSIRDQCAAAGVPYLHKQNGEWRPLDAADGRATHLVYPDGRLAPRLGLPLREILDSGAATIGRVGKKAAGRLLDGRTWDEYPA